MPDSPLQRSALGLPTVFSPRAGVKESQGPEPSSEEPIPSTSSGNNVRDRDDVSAGGSGSTLSPEDRTISHYSVSTILGITGGSNESGAPTGKLKGQLARSILTMLLGSQKAAEGQKTSLIIPEQYTDVHNLVPYGDVTGMLGVTVKNCKDFTAKFNVKNDINLLIRISIDKIMKCTNPQIYKASYSNKKNTSIYFGDVRYFSLTVPGQRSDPRNRIVLELVGYESPKDFPRLFGKVTMHLYEVIQKQIFTETCAMRIRNMVFCTIDVEFKFCYGCFGYGYSHQLRFPGYDPAQAVAYSMFLRVPPPEDRKDPVRNVMLPQHMTYPAALSKDLNVTAGNYKMEPPENVTEHYVRLQEALKQPAGERLERMKQEYRSLKTWEEKREYLDQLILKRGPKIVPKQTKMSRFRSIIEKIHADKDSIIEADTGEPTEIIETPPEEVEPDKAESFPQDIKDLALQDADVFQQELTQEEFAEEEFAEEEFAEEEMAEEEEEMAEEEMAEEEIAEEAEAEEAEEEAEAELSTELEKVQELIESIEPSPVPALHITSSSPESSEGIENLLGKTGSDVRYGSESSLASSDAITGIGDSEGPAFESRVVEEEPPVTPREEYDTQFLPREQYITPQPPEEMQEPSKEKILGSVSDEFAAAEATDSGAETQEEWPWKRAKFQDAVFSGSKFEPFLRVIGEVPAPFPRKSYKVPDCSSFEESPLTIEHKEQEDQDPPLHTSPSETKTPKPGEQLSILRLIENKGESFEEEQPVPKRTDKEPKDVKAHLTQKPSEAEVKRENICFKRNHEDVCVDKLVKVVALKSLLRKNLEKPVSEKLLQTEISQELEDYHLPNVEGLVGEREKYLLKERTLSSKEKSDTNNLKDTVMQNLQSQLLRRYTEQHIIPEMGLPGIDQKASDDLVKRNKDLLKEKTSLAEITVKPVSLPGLSSKKSLEIIRVIIPSSTETESANDVLTEKLLKEEKSDLKSCLFKRPQDKFNDQYKYLFPETGLRTKESNICQESYSGMTRERKTALEKALLEERQVSSKQGLTGVPVLNGYIKDIVLETLSENNIASLNSILSVKAQDKLLKQLSNIGSILEEELEKIVQTPSSTVTETQLEELKKPELPEVGQIPTTAESLQDRFTEEELENLKSVLGKLTKEGQREGLSESEVESLTSILQKSFDDLPVQSSSETGINKVVEIKDKFHSIPMSTTDVSTSTTGIAAYDRGKHRSKEKMAAAGEKHRGDNTDFSEHSLFEVETTDKTTQTNDVLKPLKKLKQLSKKESHRLQNPPEKPIPDMPSSQKGVEAVVKSKASEETVQRIFSEYSSSSFLSAHDIGMQTENREVSKTSNSISKPPFPVNPQTFLLLHADPHEETKSPGKAHQKAGKKKSDKSKKDMASYQAATTNPQIQREGTSSSKETLRGQKQSLSKESKVSLSGMRKDSLKQKSDKKLNKEFSPKKSFSKTYYMADLPQQDLPLAEKPSVTKYPTLGLGKGKTEKPGDETDLDSFKHLEKAIERALQDLGRGPEESPSRTLNYSRNYAVPSTSGLSREPGRSFSTNNSASGNLRNFPSSEVAQVLRDKLQHSTITPAQLDEVVRAVQTVLWSNSRSQSKD